MPPCHNQTHNVPGWTREMFRHMCILAGCDYAPKEGEGTHIKGLGLKKAGQLLTEYRTPESVIDFWAGKKLVEAVARI